MVSFYGLRACVKTPPSRNATTRGARLTPPPLRTRAPQPPKCDAFPTTVNSPRASCAFCCRRLLLSIRFVRCVSRYRLWPHHVVLGRELRHHFQRRESGGGLLRSLREAGSPTPLPAAHASLHPPSHHPHPSHIPATPQPHCALSLVGQANHTPHYLLLTAHCSLLTAHYLLLN